MKRYFAFAVVFALALTLAFTVFAAVQKYTFNNVVLADGTIVEIEAVVKDGKNAYTQITYFSDDYIQYLGFYAEPVAVGSGELLSFAISHFNDRVQ